MKKFFVLTLALNALTFGSLYAEDAPVAPEAIPAAVVVTPALAEDATAPTETVAAVVEPAAAIVLAEPAPVVVVESATPSVTVEPAAVNAEVAADNLEFISGEITAMDEVAKSVSVKMYGETAENEADKTLTVTIDAGTDITDGEQDRDLKSLTSGTEVDVEYDPTTKKATYIFVY